MPRTVIDLLQTPIIKDLVTRLALLTGRFATFESGLAGIANTTQEALDTAQAAFDASLNPRTIVSTQIVNGHLIITYSDGTTQDAGEIGGGVVPATLLNTLDDTQLRGSDIDGFASVVAALDLLLTEKGR